MLGLWDKLRIKGLILKNNSAALESKEKKESDCFIRFQNPVDHIDLPEKFTFPFYYKAHPLCHIAAIELQEYLRCQTDWDHNFGIDQKKKGDGIGKMFGVLVVKNVNGEIGYLTAFSGKLANSNNHPRFVPPVYDMLEPDGYFMKSYKEIDILNKRIDDLEDEKPYKELLLRIKESKERSISELEQITEQNRLKKAERKRKRLESKALLSSEEYNLLLKALSEESIRRKLDKKNLSLKWLHINQKLEQELATFQTEINLLKGKRKTLSNHLQQWLFNQYQFLNKHKEEQSLCDIFEKTTVKTPPPGAGECAAPKLLQYAFAHDMDLIAMAEFWWGESLSEVRVHGQYYPACQGKCKPILQHMLTDIITDPNPMLRSGGEKEHISIIYEDQYLVIINKPAELLSVPGKNVKDSVSTRMRMRYPKATCALILHRLDMSTSGLMIIPKTERSYKYIQRQFIKRTIKKRYVAILEGIVSKDSGVVDLPLRVDLDDRPRQLVCYDHGKSAISRWEVISRSEDSTRLYFYPETGRTHQLRVHAAHPLGLNSPIIGDDLYGNKGVRLMLHAESISFIHPQTRVEMRVTAPPPF